jgi:hypothetical protein
MLKFVKLKKIKAINYAKKITFINIRIVSS